MPGAAKKPTWWCKTMSPEPEAAEVLTPAMRPEELRLVEALLFCSAGEHTRRGDARAQAS